METLLRLVGAVACVVMALAVYRAARAMERPPTYQLVRPPSPRRGARLELEVHGHHVPRRRLVLQRFELGLRGWSLHVPVPFTRCRCLVVDWFAEGKRP